MGEGCSDSVGSVGGRGGRRGEDAPPFAAEVVVRAVEVALVVDVGLLGPRGPLAARAPHGGGAGGGGSRSHRASSDWRMRRWDRVTITVDMDRQQSKHE